MSAEAAEEYTASLGQIGAGFWRQIHWADQQGVPEALGVGLTEWVTDRLGGYVRLSMEDRTEAILELHELGLSNRKIAAILGVSEPTVRRVMSASNDAPELEDASNDRDDSEDDASNDAEEDEDEDEDEEDDWEGDAETAQFEEELAEDPEIEAGVFHANLLKGFEAAHKKIYIASPERIAEVASVLPALYDDVMRELDNMEAWTTAVRKCLQPTRRVRRFK
jgi:transposase